MKQTLPQQMVILGTSQILNCFIFSPDCAVRTFRNEGFFGMYRGKILLRNFPDEQCIYMWPTAHSCKTDSNYGHTVV